MGKIQTMIDRIVENGNRDEMVVLSDMLVELICDMKEAHPDMYNEYKEKLHELAYGKVILEDEAIDIVSNMLPIGEHWDIETVKNVARSYNFDNDYVDVYLVLNSLYNDYYTVFGEDEDSTSTYIAMAKAWLNDKDADKDKVYLYFTKIPKE